MKATHKIEVELTPDEIGIAISKCTPLEFATIWSAWGNNASTNDIKAIAKSWKGFNRGKQSLKKLMTATNYEDME